MQRSPSGSSWSSSRSRRPGWPETLKERAWALPWPSGSSKCTAQPSGLSHLIEVTGEVSHSGASEKVNRTISRSAARTIQEG